MTKTTTILGIVVLLVACTEALISSGRGQTSTSQPLAIVPAPVPPDGYEAGRATHIVLVLVANTDPTVMGISLRRGDTLGASLPEAFKRNDKVAIQEDSDVNLTLTKGWPQAPVKQAGQYKIFFDQRTNTVGVRAETDVGRDGANSPGAKMIHLRGETFLNPVAGEYPVEVRLADSGGKVKETWAGTIKIASVPMAARVAPTNFHLGPNANGDFQNTSVNRDAPLPLGVLLWEQERPLNGVGITAPDLVRYPKYTGGLLVQESTSGQKLDPLSGRVVGGIAIAAPPGAVGQVTSSQPGSDGKPILSGQTVRSQKFPEAQGGGKPNPGLLPIQFHAGNVPGRYQATVELIGGNAYTFTIEAQ